MKRATLEAALQSCLHGEYGRARVLLSEALERDPAPASRLEAQLLLAKVDYSEGLWEAALASVGVILARQPDHWDALKLRQKCWQKLAFSSEDVADCRRLNELQPAALEDSDLIFKSNYLWGTTPELLYEESRRWNDSYAEPLSAKIVPHLHTPNPERRIKIGYVSPDFRNHAVMKVLPCVFEKYDQRLFEVFAYFIDLQQADELTERLRGVVEHFVALPPQTDAIAERVRSDGIHILVDLAGHTMPVEALLAFALKPAPVQVSWLGVHATTGLRTMDYFLGDAHLPCPGTEHLFSEQVYRLPRAQYSYQPEAAAELAQSPHLQNGYITFGCFNNPAKVNREMVKVWSVILHVHPGSKLLFKYAVPFREITEHRLRAWFAEDGISADRLQFAGSGWSLPYMASWNQIDIALDPFPYNGGTTTLDALWMGVPVVSMSGRLAVSCCGAVFLSAVGLPVARSAEEYLALAGEMAKMVLGTPDVRQRVNQAFMKSQLMDGTGLIGALEGAFRDMWQKWCVNAKSAG